MHININTFINNIIGINSIINKDIAREEAVKNVEILFEKAEGEGIYLMAAAGYRTYDFQK